ncbi:hypothetical protein ACYX34_00280 [Nitrospira sp. CMX1]
MWSSTSPPTVIRMMLLLMVEDEEDTADLIRLNLEQAQDEVIHA